MYNGTKLQLKYFDTRYYKYDVNICNVIILKYTNFARTSIRSFTKRFMVKLIRS